MDHVSIRWEADGKDFFEEAGHLRPSEESGSGAYYGLYPEHIPQKVEARWRTADHKDHLKTVEVANEIPDATNFTGTIAYKFYDDTVTVVGVPQWLEDRNRQLGKTTVP